VREYVGSDGVNLERVFGVQATLPGMSSALKSWCDANAVPFPVSEMLSAHGEKTDDAAKRVGSQSAAYMGHKYVEERRAVRERWAKFVNRLDVRSGWPSLNVASGTRRAAG
jgi:hypothetical protein